MISKDTDHRAYYCLFRLFCETTMERVASWEFNPSSGDSHWRQRSANHIRTIVTEVRLTRRSLACIAHAFQWEVSRRP